MKRHYSLAHSLLAAWSGVLLFSIFACHTEATQEKQPELKLNHVQLIGSHNSYKEQIEPALMQLLLAENPDTKGLDYAHIPIEAQLELGLRSLELDVLHDPEGGRYTQPKGLAMLQTHAQATQPYDTTALRSPGLKTFHVPDIDFRSSCLAFTACLAEVKTWSDVHPDHLPVIITINPKSSGVKQADFTEVLPFDATALRALDAEIQAVFGAEQLITPQYVKGTHPSLREAVTQQGWPTLSAVKGRILFVLDAPENITDNYLIDNAYDRPLFVNVEATHPHAAFLIMNDPVAQEQAIQQRIAEGFLVRTRADANTKEARSGDLSRFAAAMRSGAQVISTDYYLKSLSPNQDFEIIFADSSYIRCNPALVDSIACHLSSL